MQSDSHTITSALTRDDYERFYQVLEYSGLQYYWPRIRPSTSLNLCSEHPIFCAKVLVLLALPLRQLKTDEQLILKGMLQVIPFKKNESCIAWMDCENPSQPPFSKGRSGIAAIMQWAPRSLLLLGTVFKTFQTLLESDLNIPMVQSYSPSELAENPTLKREAYNDLLGFKSKLI